MPTTAMTRREQVDHLNSTIKCTLAPSEIHGIGVFALSNISKGQKCHCLPYLLERKEMLWFDLSVSAMKDLFPEVKDAILTRFPAVYLGSGFCSPNDITWLLTYINHSDNPNYDVDTDTALRDIKKGEEIVQDYRRMDKAEEVYPFLAK